MTSDISTQVIHHVLSRNPFVNKVSIDEIFFNGEKEGYLLATSVSFIDVENEQINDNKIEHLIFNMPIKTPHIFITVTDGNPKQVRKLIANIESYERFNNNLSLNSFISLTGDEYLASIGKIGAIFLPISDSYFLKDIDPILSTGTGDRHFLYVVFINAIESEILHSDGRESLFDLWYETGRGITSVTDGLESNKGDGGH
jgi:hypothetical protein